MIITTPDDLAALRLVEDYLARLVDWTMRYRPTHPVIDDLNRTRKQIIALILAAETTEITKKEARA